MSSTVRTLVVARDLPTVWDFVKDMGNWASRMPGYISHETLGEDDSSWTLQVNVGPFTRPVVIDVRVTSWHAPTQVLFEVKGRSDPFKGSGAFRAASDERGTAITLEFGAEGTGSMAMMISTMVPPVLNYVGDGFSANLAAALGGDISRPVAAAPAPGLLRRLWSALLRIFGLDDRT